ncbi:MAG: GAF domain-containing protein [Myxococcales bacterium]|nr:GAF domain-containing protein [Myxococcales bacterium]
MPRVRARVATTGAGDAELGVRATLRERSEAPGATPTREAAPHAAPGSPTGLEQTLTALARLRATVAGAVEHAAAFRQAVDTRLDLLAAYAASAHEQIAASEQRAQEAAERARQAAAELEAAQEQTARLTCLYVATLELHSTLDPVAVRTVIASILENLLGAQGYSVLLWNPEARSLEVVHSRGLPATDRLVRGSYHGGDPVLDAALADGSLHMGPSEGSTLHAVVPLRVVDATVGLLVIATLLGHKARLDERDRDMLELLASHAASGLYLAELHASRGRKLRTLEDLVKLARPK